MVCTIKTMTLQGSQRLSDSVNDTPSELLYGFRNLKIFFFFGHQNQVTRAKFHRAFNFIFI